MIGLTTAEAIAKRSQYGANVFVEEKHQSAFGSFLKEFKSPLVLLLLAAALISFASGSKVSASIIISIVILSSVIDFSISYRSQKAAEALAKTIAPRTNVMRDGKEVTILLADLVPGDVVNLSAGNLIPADGTVMQTVDFFVNESSLTGESLPVEKPEHSDVVLGSGVVSGHASVLITATGTKTKFSHIIKALGEDEAPSGFERGIKDFTVLITRIALVMMVIVFAVNALVHGNVLESLIFALAIAVGITPELLPMIIAFNVSKSSIRMSHQGVIVKRLSAIENFGGMDVFCSDKTGTLTEDRISVVKFIDGTGADSLDVLELAYVNSKLHTSASSPLDAAIDRYKDFDMSSYAKIDEIPFDFERRRDSLLVSHAGTSILIIKGAPESVLDVSLCDDAAKKKALDLFEALSAEGYRVLAIGSKVVTAGIEHVTLADEVKFDFKGFIAFIDPPKAGVKEVLDEMKRRRVSIKIITGDHRLVAEKIAREVGFEDITTLEAAEIDTLNDLELTERAEKTTIFARVTPLQKNRIIKALQRGGHVVGYMGDGINDAPALRTADVGISVDNAVDVAKEAADIILVEKSLERLIDGIVEGRRTFTNTLKYVTMSISSNFGNMFSMTGASFVLPFLPMLPVQVLLNNLLYESSQFSLSFDTVDDDALNIPKPWDIAYLKKFMIIFGTLSSVFDFVTFFVLFKVLHLSAPLFQTGWFIESFATQALVVFLIRIEKPFFKKHMHAAPALTISIIASLAVAWYLALSSFGSFFGFVPPGMSAIAIIAFIVLMYLVSVEITKYFFYKMYTRTSPAFQKKGV